MNTLHTQASSLVKGDSRGGEGGLKTTDQNHSHAHMTLPTLLVGLNASVLAGSLFSPAFDRFLWKHATLFPGTPFRRRPYTLLTHAIHHLSPLHCLANCLALYSFGGAATSYLRPTRLLALYTAAAAAGGAAHLAHASASYGSESRRACLGASGAVLGLATFVQLLNPWGQTLVFFVVPVYNIATVALMGGASVYYGFVRPDQDRSGLAHAGHLGGMAAGAAAALAARRGVLRW